MASVDPRRPIVEVMARLGRETQLHVDERELHFTITQKIVVMVSVLLLLLSAVNVYYVTVLYRDLNGIVDNMDSMYRNLARVERDMDTIARRFGHFDRDIQLMTPITADMAAITQVMPDLRDDMIEIRNEMLSIDNDMHQMTNAMGGIAVQMTQMTNGVSIMRQNVRSIAGPMGAMNPIIPN